MVSLVNYLRVVVAAVFYAVVAQVIHTLGAMVEMPFYMDPNYFQVWSKMMMPSEGAPPASFFAYSVTVAIITGVILAAVFSVVGKALHGTPLRRGVTYGFIVFLLAGLLGAFSLYMLINLPPMLIVYWTVENLIVFLLSGAAFGKLIQL